MTNTIQIPDRYRMRCEFCATDLDVRSNGVYQFTSGWVMNRDGGGGHGVSLPQRANRYAHRTCVEKAVRGMTNQASMF